MVIHQLSVDEAIASVGSKSTGLSTDQAAERLREYGPNRIAEIAAESSLLRLLKEFIHFFALILWIAAGFAFLAEWMAPGQGMAKIGIAIVVVILVSGVFSFWQERRVERTLAALRKLLPQSVKVMRDGSVAMLAAEALVPGDIVLFGQGDNIPADCRLVEAFGVRVNNATVTGESAAQARNAEPSSMAQMLHAENVLLAGTSVVAGEATAVVFATGSHSEFGRIALLTQTERETESPLRTQVAHLSRLIGVMSVIIGIAFFFVSRVIGIPFWDGFIFAIGIIVAMVPEGLLPTLTLALVLATQRMAKRNVLIRYLPAVETLGSATVICTDKTGTLTQNIMTVRRIFLGNGSVLTSSDHFDEAVLSQYRELFMIARLCHDLKEGLDNGRKVWLGDAMEIGLVDLAERAIPELPTCRKVDEIPFDTNRMRLSVVYAMPEGTSLYCKGAPEKVLAICNRILIDGSVASLRPEQRAGIRHAQDAMAQQGLRVIALAYRPMEQEHGAPENELIFAGLMGLEDPPRPEVAEALQKCRDAGVKVIMITGDHPITASSLAREIGLVESDNPRVVTGDQLAALSNTQLRLLLDAPEIIFARVGPDQKLRIVEALKQKGQIVAVTGDGVNDAPALKSAHIGIAMGVSGTDVAKASADMILLDDNFASIVNAIEEGRAVYSNIRRFLTYILAHNVPELIPYLAFSLFRIPLALTPLQILSIDMGTDSLTALGLGVERPAPEVMRRPPRAPEQRLIDWPLALHAYLFLGLIEAAIAMGAFFFVLRHAGWHYGKAIAASNHNYMRATTACFSAIVVLQIVNVFICRSATRSVVTTGIMGNSLIWGGVLLEVLLVLAIDYTPWGNQIFGTVPITAQVWLFVLPLAVAMLFAEEIRKAIARSLRKDASQNHRFC